MSSSKRRATAAIIFLLLLAVIAAAGCGGKAVVDSSKTESNLSEAGDSDFIEGDEGKTGDEKGAAEGALEYVSDANPGSRFKVVDITVADGWARVVVEEAGVPTEEAISFGVYLRKIDGGKWDVAKTGPGVKPEHLPEAPEEIFVP